MLKIGIIDDDSEDYVILREFLRDVDSGFEIEHLRNYDDGLLAAKSQAHSAYLVDYRLGSDNGLDLIAEAIGSGCRRPMVLVTGFDDPTLGKRALQAGAADFVPKEEASPSLLVRVLSHALERARLQEQLDRYSGHDALTGLANRSLFQHHCARAIARAMRARSMFAVIYVDLDHFKEINDTLGHACGDQLLIKAARRLQGSVRQEDVVARLGGDEFCLLAEGLKSLEDAETVAAKLTDSLTTPVTLDGHEAQVSASVGVAVWPDHGSTVADLTRKADAAMYTAKRHGRNDYRIFRPEMAALADRSEKLCANLPEAIAGNRLQLGYIPRRDLPSGRLTGLMVIPAWRVEPDRAICGRELLNLAEESDASQLLATWLINRLCDELRELRDEASLDGLHVCIQGNAGLLRSQRFHDALRAAGEGRMLQDFCLEIAVRECELHEMADDEKRVIHELDVVGARLVIDEFGERYSALPLLMHYPVAALEIHRHFINRLGQDPHAPTIVEGLVLLAHHLGLRVIGCGPVTAQNLELLRGTGCDEYEDLETVDPLPAVELAPILARAADFPG